MSTRTLQASPSKTKARAAAVAAPQIVHDALRTPGQPLEPRIRTTMEGYFGHDLGRIRIHADGDLCAASAAAVRARAYTVGPHIVLGARQAAFHTAEGQRLLAHEIAHALEQPASASVPQTLEMGRADDVAERRADLAAESFPVGALHRMQAAKAAPCWVAHRSSVAVLRRKEASAEPATAGSQEIEPAATSSTPRDQASRGRMPEVPKPSREDLALIAQLEDHARQPHSLHIKTFREIFVRRFEKNARDVTLFLLAWNERLAEAEYRRYAGVSSEKNPSPLGEATSRRVRGRPDPQLTALRRAAARIAPFQKEFARQQKELADQRTLASVRARGPSVAVEESVLEDEARWARIEADPDVVSHPNEFEGVRKQETQGFATLQQPGIDYAKIAAMDDEDLRRYALDQALEVLKNIRKARAGLDSSKLWELEPIIRMTTEMLGIQPGSEAHKLVADKRHHALRDKTHRDLVIAGIGIVLAVAGAAIGGWGAAVAYLAVAGGSVWQTVDNFQESSFKRAAAGTAYNPDLAIGDEDPSLAWFFVDLVAAGLDVHQFIAAAKVAVQVTRLGRAIKATAGSLPAKREELLAEFKRVLRAEAPALQMNQAGIERLVNDMKYRSILHREEARSEVAVMITLLNQKNKKLLKPLVIGNQKALEKLAEMHGDYRSLQQFLEVVSANMNKPAAAFGKISTNLTLSRNHHVNSLFKRLGAKPAPGSKHGASDVDEVVDTGAKLIAGEKSMKRKIGARWSPAQRMNFYTSVERHPNPVLERLQLAKEGKLTEQQLENTIQDYSEVARETRIFATARQLQSAADEKVFARILADVRRDMPVADQKRLWEAFEFPAKEVERRRNTLLLELDEHWKKLPKIPREEQDAYRMMMFKKQTEANFLTREASIAPAALRQNAYDGVVLDGWEAVGAMESQFAEFLHFMHETSGKMGAGAAFHYEFYKYIKRVCGAYPKSLSENSLRTKLMNTADEALDAKRDAAWAWDRETRQKNYKDFLDFYYDAIHKARENARANPMEFGTVGKPRPDVFQALPVLPPVVPYRHIPTQLHGAASKANKLYSTIPEANTEDKPGPHTPEDLPGFARLFSISHIPIHADAKKRNKRRRKKRLEHSE